MKASASVGVVDVPCVSESGCLRSVSRTIGKRRSSAAVGLPTSISLYSALDLAPKVAGFSVRREVPAIEVRPEGVAGLSFPEELLTHEPCAEAVRAVFKGGDTERTVHCHVELSAEEQHKLEVMRAAAQEESLEFLPCVASAASRYLARAKGDPRRALKEMVATQEWRLNYFKDGPILNSSIEADLALGVVYFAGRDRWLRPALVVRPARIPAAWQKDKRVATDKLVRLLVFCMEYMQKYMLLPGRVEGGVVLVDMAGLTSTQVPFGPLKSIVTVMANHYVNRIFRFYALNLPPALGMSVQFGMRFLTDRQKMKMHVVKDLDELRQEFALHQLEQDFGGSRPVVERFFPFPLPAGPFEAGSAEGPRPDAVQGVHQALTAECLQGRPWDSALSREENRQLRFTAAAVSLLPGQLAQAVGLPAPALVAAASAAASPEVPVATGEGPLATGRISDSEAEAALPSARGDEEVLHRSTQEPSSGDGEAEAAEVSDSLTDSEAEGELSGCIPPLQACGGKEDAGVEGSSTSDELSSSSTVTGEEQSSTTCTDTIELEDAVVHPAKSWFCMPFQCTARLA